jgi:hypothetical protein
MTPQKTRSARSARLAGAAALALVACVASLDACGSDQDVPNAAEDGGGDGAVSPPADGSGLSGDDAAVSDASAPNACDDASGDAADIDCTGKCGPVKDPCTGALKMCGGCANAVGADGGDGGVQVCDLATNTCTTPKTTCAELGAECGTVKDTCGEYLDCPDTNPKGCAAGKECDPDTHKCRDCQPVTCADLGVECGSAWLGCGEDKPANYTDCGGCSADADGGARTCNAVFHVCEPTCVPKPAKELCEAAKAKKGVECGVISNGCGGTVSCDAVPGFGCKGGESCGVRGIANRCDAKAAPDECKALGKDCGTIKSACTGQVIKCGDCANGEVCNANGVCGPPCTPKACSDFSQYECGTFDDGCGATVTCGTCANGVCDGTTHTCCATNTCAGTYAGKCGTQLANGCGQSSLTCACPNGASCTVDGGASPAPAPGSTGSCCTPKGAASYSSAGQCGTNLPNGCGQNNVNVSCPNGGVCVNNQTGSPGPAPPNGVPGTCCTLTDTCAGQPADSCASIQNTCRPPGTMIGCTGNCNGGKTCNGGTCCTRPTCAGNGGEGGECNVTKPANGCGSDVQCSCAGGRTCWCTDHQCVAGTDGPGVCKAALSCGSPAYAGQCGTGLDNGLGGKLDCGCGSGKVCSTSTPGQLGACQCANGLGAPYTCANVPNGPKTGGDQCGAFSNGCGGTLSCNCPGGQTCNTAANPNVCCTPTSCPAKALGSACGTLGNDCGGTLSCGCPGGSGNENFKCTAGTCQCEKDTCRGRTGPQPDRCGGTLQCGG